MQVEHINTSTRASYGTTCLFVGDNDTVLLHFFVTGVRKQSEATFTTLFEDIRSLATPSLRTPRHELTQSFDEDVADRLADTYDTIFAWQRETSAKQPYKTLSIWNHCRDVAFQNRRFTRSTENSTSDCNNPKMCTCLTSYPSWTTSVSLSWIPTPPK